MALPMLFCFHSTLQPLLQPPRNLGHRQLEQQSFGDTLLDSDSDSDLSDMGAEDVALVKMRARTPPWQKVWD